MPEKEFPIVPKLDRIIVEKTGGEEEITEGGIHLPENSQGPRVMGKVLAVGLGKFDEKGNRIPMKVRVGETILFPVHLSYEGGGFKYEGKEYMVLTQRDVMGKVRRREEVPA